MTDRVMLDIETLGTEPGCAILSIGAVRFDESGHRDWFYKEVDLTSCTDAGLTIESKTLEWWLGQDGAVSDVLTGGESLPQVLSEFSSYYGEADEIWANSPSFDCSILGHAYELVGYDIPWEYYQERCYRTLRALSVAPDIERDGVEHHALDDAEHQARIASEALARLSEEAIADV